MDIGDILSVIRVHWYVLVSMMMLATSFGVAAAYLMLTTDRSRRPVSLFGPLVTAGPPVVTAGPGAAGSGTAGSGGVDGPVAADAATASVPPVSGGARRSGHSFAAVGAGRRRAGPGRRPTAPDCARVVETTAARHVFRVRGRGPLR